MPSYRHIFFDLDHTLWDFEANSAATLAQLYHDFNLEQLGVPGFEAFRSTYEMHNEKFWERFRKGYVRREELRWKRMWHTLLDFRIGNTDMANQMSHIYLDLLPQQGKLMPYALEALEHCRSKDYKLHLITNGFETTQWQKMRTSGIDHYFGEVITSERSNSMKPKAGIFDFALHATGATRNESMMIGDSLEADIDGAANYGMDYIYYNPLRKPHTRKLRCEIDCLSRIKELL